MGLYCEVKHVENELAGIPLAGLHASLGKMRTTFDAYLENDVFPAVEADIAAETGRAFNEVTRDYVLPGSGMPKLFLPTRPVTRAVAVRLNIIPSVQWYEFTAPSYLNVYDETQTKIREASPEATYEKADVLVDVAAGTLTIPPRIAQLALAGAPFFTYTMIRVHEDIPNVEVQVKTGYATIPADIKMAAARMAALWLMPSIDATQTAGMREWSIGDEKRSWGTNPVALPPQQKGIWGRYQYTGIYSEKARQFQAYASRVLATRKMLR